MKLSIIIPVFNEIKTLAELIEKVSSVKLDKELVIVDDFSADGSSELLKNNYKQRNDIRLVFHSKNRGKGAAIKSGLGYVQGAYTIIQDADLEYNPEDYSLLLNEADAQQADVVYGSRFLKTWKVTSFWHFLVNKTLTAITNVLFQSNLTDMETCYKLIKTNVLKELALQSDGFDIEAEITAKLLKRKYRIFEVPISYKGRSYQEGKKITWKDGVVTLWLLIKYKLSA